MAISLELSCLLSTLLQLSTNGEGLGSSFPRGRSGAVRHQKLGCGEAGQGWGLSQEPCLRIPPGSGDNVAARTARSWYWGCPEYRGSCGQGSVPSKVGPFRASFLWDLHSHGSVFLGSLCTPASVIPGARSLRRVHELSSLEPGTSFPCFPEIVAVWGAVSDYMLGQLKLDKVGWHPGPPHPVGLQSS